jgi:hypothetical protein
MNGKIKAFLLGCLEAFGGGFVLGLAIVWNEPGSVVLSLDAMKAAGEFGIRYGLFYFLGFLRMNAAFKAPALPSEDDRRLSLNLPPKRPPQ